jgi:regulation of enolase protein 1 (concanavalin A-like superfamily)
MDWYNEPAKWSADDEMITITANAKTDFWRKTHDGGIRDNGHFYFQPVRGDFTADVKFTADYHALYDQAGLMVRLDEQTWLKCGVELFNGVLCASAVVTRDFSDWSVVPLVDAPPVFWLRVARHGSTVEVSYSRDGGAYTLLRQAHLTDVETVSVGVMVCAPTGDGFTAMFEEFKVLQDTDKRR